MTSSSEPFSPRKLGEIQSKIVTFFRNNAEEHLTLNDLECKFCIDVDVIQFRNVVWGLAHRRVLAYDASLCKVGGLGTFGPGPHIFKTLRRLLPETCGAKDLPRLNMNGIPFLVCQAVLESPTRSLTMPEIRRLLVEAKGECIRKNGYILTSLSRVLDAGMLTVIASNDANETIIIEGPNLRLGYWKLDQGNQDSELLCLRKTAANLTNVAFHQKNGVPHVNVRLTKPQLKWLRSAVNARIGKLQLTQGDTNEQTGSETSQGLGSSKEARKG